MTAWIFTRTQVGPRTAAQQPLTKSSREVRSGRRSGAILHARYVTLGVSLKTLKVIFGAVCTEVAEQIVAVLWGVCVYVSKCTFATLQI